MEIFFDENDTIKEIALVILVKPGEGSTVHKNRKWHGVAMNCGGERIYKFDTGEKISVKKNELIYFPKGSSYTMFEKSDGEIYCINYQISNEKSCAPFLVRFKNAEEVLGAYQRAEKIWKRNKEGAIFLCKAELYKILYEIFKEKNAPYIPENKVEILKPAIDYIHKKYTEELISVKKLSELCHMSYEYFRRLFNKFYGTSPIKYINELKLKRAKDLLLSGMYSVGDTAMASGFADFSHFSRFFKEKEGVWPSEYALKIETTQKE